MTGRKGEDQSSAVAAFIRRWADREGGQERANYVLFLAELCDVLGVDRPDPASATTHDNDYVFERSVREAARDGGASTKRIDLYKRDSFVLEAKQSRQEGGSKAIAGQLDLLRSDDGARGRRGGARAWDVLMLNARRQAEDYVRLLPTGHEPPPFIIVCDVGHCLEIYANFRRDGKAYDQFPDRKSFRVYLDDLDKPEIRERLKAIWLDPQSLDPTRKSARVTREIAERLAAVSKALEGRKDARGKSLYAAEDVAAFLSRCLFTMFAEDVGLLPEASFKDVLERCEADPDTFSHDVGQLWEAMDVGGYAHAIRKSVKRFNGQFFKNRATLPLGREEIGELKQAASYNWKDVEPAIFGTLLEQALDPLERRRLGAHYTPRPYVERLVIATVMEPLRAEWETVLNTIELKKGELAGIGPNDPRRDAVFRDARNQALAFHAKLCATRVLDPACGTGNFLYVTMELMKRLEGEVIEAVEALGGQSELAWLDRATVDPHQFLGLEINPRAAAIAELVLWLGYLQWHFRTQTNAPPEPILKAFRNIKVMDAVLQADRELARGPDGKPLTKPGPDGAAMEVTTYKNPRRPEWPMAEYIVGNPPFIGGKDIRARMGDAYVEALWAANKPMNESADFVMYWWDRAAELLTAKGTVLKRFGLVTTNSISQVFQRRVMERHLKGKKPVSLLMAIPDHPWRKAGADVAAVRIAMTVASAGGGDGVLREVVREAALDSDQPVIELVETTGQINSDLTLGADVTGSTGLKANNGISSPGLKLHGAGFIVKQSKATAFGLGKRDGLEKHIRPYRNGKDITGRSRDAMVIDLFGLDIDFVREKFPEVYQHLKLEVKEKTRINKEGKTVYVGRDWNNREYRKSGWWLFGENVPDLRAALQGINRYIVTVETAKHRVFQFLDAAIAPDNMLVVVASSDALHLGILSSRIHASWALRSGGRQGVGNDPRYSKSRCFDPFPFPDASDQQKSTIRSITEDLDAHRKRVLAAHPHLTLTGLYNVLEKLKAGVAPTALEADDRRIFDDGLVLILQEHHAALDAAVADAYGWPVDAPDDAILARLVALNHERAREEQAGHVRWLRPDFQIPRFGTATDKAQLALVGGQGAGLAETVAKGGKPAFPSDDYGQMAAVMAALASAPGALDAATIAATFRQGQRIRDRVTATLTALVRTGWISSGDGGKSFAMRRVA